MKSESVGDITRSGGFSRLVRDVEQSGEPIEILRQNESVAILFPSNREINQLFEQAFQFGKTLAQIEKMDATQSSLFLYLVNQYVLGLQAKSILALHWKDAPIDEMENALINSQRYAVGIFQRYMDEKLYMNNSTEEVGNAGEQPAAPSNGNTKRKRGVVKNSPTPKRKK